MASRLSYRHPAPTTRARNLGGVYALKSVRHLDKKGPTIPLVAL